MARRWDGPWPGRRGADGSAEAAGGSAGAGRGQAAGEDARPPADRIAASGEDGARQVAGAGADRPAGRPADDRTALAAATPPGTPLPSRPVKRIGSAPLGPAPEPKPLLTPVDSGRPRRLSRTRRAPSASARWAVRIIVLLLMIAITVVLFMLLGSAL